ncbi:KH domain-containing protein [Bdellovibrio sp. 22V]|uniref:KH domain-containing protein n=1 Tax=Bdellovibrio TaxID=958 RepID=UPI00254381EC|nr:KH domain-containing protein [Bdellovibrio sp. 22V]WII73380.1 KH domain-containing protein [Bdellovibrio sp. 22V]
MNSVQTVKVVGLNKSFRDEVGELIRQILATMLNNAERVTVTYEVGTRTTVFKVDCHPDDYGQLLGKQGRNIEGLRRITIAMMAKYGCRAIIEIPYVKKDTP